MVGVRTREYFSCQMLFEPRNLPFGDQVANNGLPSSSLQNCIRFSVLGQLGQDSLMPSHKAAERLGDM